MALGLGPRRAGERLHLDGRRVGHVLLVHARGRVDPQALAFAGGLPEDPDHRLVVLDLPTELPEASWPALARLLGRRDGGLRLVAGRRPRGGLLPLGQWLADHLDRTVLVGDGDVVPAAGGVLYIPGDGGSGWVRLKPGRPAVPVSRRFPAPIWEFSVADRPWDTSDRAVADPLPSGVWLHPRAGETVLGDHRGKLEARLACQRDLLTVVLGCPGTPELPLDDISRFWGSVLPGARSQVRFVRYGPLAVPGNDADGQVLADRLDSPVVVYNGLPVGRALWEPPRTHTVDDEGMLGWATYAKELCYLPVRMTGGRPTAPTVLSHRPVLADVPEIAPGVYRYARDAVLEVVPSGLWMRPAEEPAEAAVIRSAAADPRHPRIVHGTASRAAGRMRELAENLLSRLDPVTRGLTRLVPASHLARDAGAERPARAAVPEAERSVPAPRAGTPAPVRPGFLAALATEVTGPATAPVPPAVPAPAAPVPPAAAQARAAHATATAGTAGGTTEQGPVGVASGDSEPGPVRVASEAPAPPARTPAAASAPGEAGQPSRAPEEPPAQVRPPQPPLPPAAFGPEPAEPPTAAPPPALPDGPAAPGGTPHPPPAPRPDRSEPLARPAPPVPALRLVSAPAPGGGAPAPAPRPGAAHAQSAATAPPPAEPAPAREPTPRPALSGTGPAALARPQPVPSPAACALPPAKGLARERAWLRGAFRQQYNDAAGTVARVLSQAPGLRGTGETSTEDVVTDLVAARLYLRGDGAGAPLDQAVRGATVGPHVPLARCVTAGLRRLPSYRGATLLRARLDDAGWAWYGSRRLVTEWAFCWALTSVTAGLPGDTDFLIWSMTARRTALLDPEPADRVLFLPGTSFKVLAARDGDRRTVLLRELSASEIGPDGQVDVRTTPLDEIALSGLDQAHRIWQDAEAQSAPELPEAVTDRFGAPPGLLTTPGA